MMSKSQKFSRIAAGVCAAAVLSLGTVSVAAPAPTQDGQLEERRPPRPQPAGKAPIVTSTLLGALLSGVVIFAGLMPVKRSHQD